MVQCRRCELPPLGKVEANIVPDNLSNMYQGCIEGVKQLRSMGLTVTRRPPPLSPSKHHLAPGHPNATAW